MPRPLQFRGKELIWVPVFALALALPLTAWYWFFLSPLQKQYLVPFGWSQMQAGPGGGPVWSVFKTAPRRKPELAHDGDVVSVTPTGNMGLPMKLSPVAQSAGWTGLTLSRQLFPPNQYGPFLQEQFFAGKSLGRWMLSPLLFGMILCVLLFGSRTKMGWQTGDEERHGRRTKGPELVSARRWNRSGKASGIRFRLQGTLGLPGPSWRVPRSLESSHILLMGDTGSGKSNAIRQILRQVEARGETAVVYDPAGEFAQEFYRPERGDFLLNPLDERCPEWSLMSELTGRGMEYAIAAAMLPEKEYGKDFFTEAPRRVLARLLHKKPSVSELLQWMADPEEIERRVEGTPEAAYLDRKAGPQRGGVIASLNMIADSLALLPTGGELFRTEQWRYERTRWVFLTSRPSVRERLLPLHSVWLDLLILRMMEPCANSGASGT